MHSGAMGATSSCGKGLIAGTSSAAGAAQSKVPEQKDPAKSKDAAEVQDLLSWRNWLEEIELRQG